MGDYTDGYAGNNYVSKYVCIKHQITYPDTYNSECPECRKERLRKLEEGEDNG